MTGLTISQQTERRRLGEGRLQTELVAVPRATYDTASTRRQFLSTLVDRITQSGDLPMRTPGRHVVRQITHRVFTAQRTVFSLNRVMYPTVFEWGNRIANAREMRRRPRQHNRRRRVGQRDKTRRRIR